MAVTDADIRTVHNGLPNGTNYEQQTVLDATRQEVGGNNDKFELPEAWCAVRFEESAGLFTSSAGRWPNCNLRCAIAIDERSWEQWKTDIFHSVTVER
jgi:hypothetical protein